MVDINSSIYLFWSWFPHVFSRVPRWGLGCMRSNPSWICRFRMLFVYFFVSFVFLFTFHFFFIRYCGKLRLNESFSRIRSRQGTRRNCKCKKVAMTYKDEQAVLSDFFVWYFKKMKVNISFELNLFFWAFCLIRLFLSCAFVSLLVPHPSLLIFHYLIVFYIILFYLFSSFLFFR